MSEINKTFRIRTDIGEKLSSDYITLDANLVQDYDTFDILSVKINSVDTYKLHNDNYTKWFPCSREFQIGNLQKYCVQHKV